MESERSVDDRFLERRWLSFDAWISTMLELLASPDGIASFTTLVTYQFGVVDPLYHDELRGKLDRLGVHARGVTMTIAEFLEEKGSIATSSAC